MQNISTGIVKQTSVHRKNISERVLQSSVVCRHERGDDWLTVGNTVLFVETCSALWLK